MKILTLIISFLFLIFVMLVNAQILKNKKNHIIWEKIPVLVSGEMSSTTVDPCKKIYKNKKLYEDKIAQLESINEIYSQSKTEAEKQSEKNKFQLNVGYSDHSPGSLVVLASIALGSSIRRLTYGVRARIPKSRRQQTMRC